MCSGRNTQYPTKIKVKQDFILTDMTSTFPNWIANMKIQNVGGLMMSNSTLNKNIVPNPRTEAFREINGKERVQLYGVGLCGKTICLVCNIYIYIYIYMDTLEAKRTTKLPNEPMT